jgi:outer membrane protein assembly factor BamA
MFTAALFGQVRSVEITASDLPTETLGPTAYQLASFGVSGIYDRRDSILNPTSGWVAGLSADSHSTQVGQAWVRTTGRLTIHYPLPYRVRFAASGRFGVLSASSEVPIDERFFLGGSTTVRSFQERALGKAPDQSAPLGGSSFGLINLEADFPVWNKLRGALFFDAGSLSPKGIDIPTSNYRRAIGLGARYALPVGPVRLDVGVNPAPAAGEPRSAANLSFGFAF